MMMWRSLKASDIVAALRQAPRRPAAGTTAAEKRPTSTEAAATCAPAAADSAHKPRG